MDVDRRLRALERRSRLTLAALAGVVLAWLVSASGGNDVVRARKLELVDAEGRTRAELAIDPDGSAGLFVRDEEARVRAAVVHDAEQSALYLFDEEGTVRLGAAQFAHGGGGLALHGPHSDGAAVLYLKDRGSLTFHAKDGSVVARLPD